jgi:hypothetical protein
MSVCHCVTSTYGCNFTYFSYIELALRDYWHSIVRDLLHSYAINCVGEHLLYIVSCI